MGILDQVHNDSGENEDLWIIPREFIPMGAQDDACGITFTIFGC